VAAPGRRKQVTLSRGRITPRPPEPALFIRTVRGMGRGVFAGRRYRKGEVIEVCPVVPLTRRGERMSRGTILDRYFFAWNEPGYVVAIVLGYGMIYNTSPDANCRYSQRWGTRDMVYRAARDIEPGEQILVDYGWKPGEFDIPAPATRPRAGRPPAKGRVTRVGRNGAGR
jgi:uncharacterized protein